MNYTQFVIHIVSIFLWTVSAIASCTMCHNHRFAPPQIEPVHLFQDVTIMATELTRPQQPHTVVSPDGVEGGHGGQGGAGHNAGAWNSSIAEARVVDPNNVANLVKASVME